VVQVALEVGTNLVVNTDTHAPGDLINYEMAGKIAMGAGLPKKMLSTILKDNPQDILRKKGII
jgi:histidinol phosphatase-like PHP family hydrolase